VQARALEGLGRTREATAAWQRAWERDPSLPGGPLQHLDAGSRVESTFVVASEPVPEAAPAPAAEPPAARPAPATKKTARPTRAKRPRARKARG
jgi:hypothetical protein